VFQKTFFISAVIIIQGLGQCLTATRAMAQEDAELAPAAERLSDSLRHELITNYPGTRIELANDVRWTSGALPEDFESVSFRGETSRGELLFAVTSPSTRKQATGQVSFSAWAPARIALKRVHPGDKLSAEQFRTQEINVASGMAREYRGVILEPETPVGNLEARQTVLEGQFLLTTAVQRVPDIRRGDSVRVQLTANGLSLSTLGVAEEPAYLNGQVRVMASRTKRELVGKLLPNGIVEVKL
jgi:flagella basal body P-ring formation protein FlgA